VDVKIIKEKRTKGVSRTANLFSFSFSGFLISDEREKKPEKKKTGSQAHTGLGPRTGFLTFISVSVIFFFSKDNRTEDNEGVIPNGPVLSD